MNTGFFLALILFGVFVGAFAGLLGVGGGIFMVPFLVIVAGLDQHVAQATSLLVVLPTAVVATGTLHRKGIGDVRVALSMGLCGVVGAAGGALLALTLSSEGLKLVFAALLAFTGLRLGRKTLKAPRAPSDREPGARSSPDRDSCVQEPLDHRASPDRSIPKHGPYAPTGEGDKLDPIEHDWR